MKRRSGPKAKVPEKVLERARALVTAQAPRETVSSAPAPAAPAPSSRTEKSPRHEVKEKVVARLRRFHPMD